ncbi:MAG TPA: GTPase domain-containing protein [Verrucomicrobiales bacterium]|nr:GTPase domain-containing protein [Verrucomicrobiales bacterium]
MPSDAITLSLISHTNVGKTTLARTLLRRDVGDAIDQEHVTDVATAYPMIEAGGQKLLLWDTPGFGSTPKLLKRLRLSASPIRWMLTQMWDRFRDRPLWCSQQAIKNVQQEADVVLYLVNASEQPGATGYVDMEMEILTWIGKPVVLLLNQTGAPRPPLEEELEETDWRYHLEKYGIVKAVLGLDAFARCWIQEEVLMEVIFHVLPEWKREGFNRLRSAWHEQNLTVFRRSMKTLGKQLAESAVDRVTVSKESLLQKIGVGRQQLNSEMEDARTQLTERLANRSVATTDELIRLHGLEGHTSESIKPAGANSFGVPQKVNESLWSAVGGALSGAAGGLIAELKTGGMMFGGGTVAGLFIGGAGSWLLARGYNLTRGEDNCVRWTAEHFAAQAELILVTYLAVAHFGRGRGEWKDGEHPAHWPAAAKAIIETHRSELDALWKRAGEKECRPDVLAGTAEAILASAASELLAKLYPKVSKAAITAE